MYNPDQYNLYKDIQARTNGEIYIGVVGPVRTGKSTFIKKFMEQIVIPNIEDTDSRERAIDELPQSAAGRTVMTTEPKFIPKEAAEIKIANDIKMSVRMIDCVGYMVDGAIGHLENDTERMVKTPWFDHAIPFTQAAETGTRKVITDHSSIGIVVTTDGSIGEIERNDYVNAEEKTINELKKIGKPFIVILNTLTPLAKETNELAAELSAKYGAMVVPVNAAKLKKEDINMLLTYIIEDFPVTGIYFYPPSWTGRIENSEHIKSELIRAAKEVLRKFVKIRDVKDKNIIVKTENNDTAKDTVITGEEMKNILSGEAPEDVFYSDAVNEISIKNMDIKTGTVAVCINLKDECYYNYIGSMIKEDIEDEYRFFDILKELADKKREFEKVSAALEQINQIGYGVVTPLMEEIELEEPVIIKHGSRYGVKIRATAPSVHMIQADIVTEIAPIVGSEEQAKDLINYIMSCKSETNTGIWDANIFGKSMKQLVEEGISTKINRLSSESRSKLKDTMHKIVNESNGGIVCIII